MDVGAVARRLYVADAGVCRGEQFAAADAGTLFDRLGLTKSRVVELQGLLQQVLVLYGGRPWFRRVAQDRAFCQRH